LAGDWPELATRLEGSLVVLEPLAPGHEQGLFEAARFPEIWTWLDEYVAATPARFHEWMEEALAASAAGGEAAFATIDAANARPIGSTRYLALRPLDRALEVGWTWLTPAAWSTGANAEAKLLMLEHAFERLGCVRVEFKTDARNHQTRGALLALGARFEGIARKHMMLPTGPRDSAWYAVTDDDWPAVRARLEARLAAR